MLFYDALKPKRILPIYSPAMVNFELVDSSMQHVKKFHRIADFKLKNQNNKWVTQNTFENKIYVADFFFTTCPSICPIMTENMSVIQNTFKNDSSVLLLSHSVTPKIDSVAQLKKYALEKGIIDEKWHLVTGPKKEIYDLARQSYLAVKTNVDGNLYDMIHTENFILIDPDKRIRGFYDGTVKEDMKEIQNDILNLKAEYSIN
ncbi:MAG: protein SCO1/2 [Candidatus Marivariicella framensis]|jgi:protein SCO1/2|tara:strand:- start:3677 stop:4285 length:609 start_codon:yes stop_codon:yes gene_type:complete